LECQERQTHNCYKLGVGRIVEFEGNGGVVAVKGYIHDIPRLDIVSKRAWASRKDKCAIGRLAVRARYGKSEILALLRSILKRPSVSSRKRRKGKENSHGGHDGCFNEGSTLWDEDPRDGVIQRERGKTGGELGVE